MRTIRGRIFVKGGLATVLAVAFLAAPALADARTYTGTIVDDDATEVSLTVKKHDGRRVITAFSAKNFLITCDQDIQARLGSAAISGTTKVSRKGRFSVTADNGAQVVQLAGKLVGSDTAVGTVRYSGLTKVDVEDQTMRIDCDSGRLDWRATH